MLTAKQRTFVLVGWLMSAAAQACTIPVFRYALDRWPADPYELQISADDSKDDAVSKFLRNFTDSTPINVHPARLREGGESHLLFPHTELTAPALWTGRLGENLPRLLDSPARTEVAQRILGGHTGVWLLVESNDKAANDAAAAAMEKRLRYLEHVAQLPMIDPTDPSSQLGPGPALAVKFSLIRVRREDVAEQPFIKMLAGPKGVETYGDGPWLALVFGRGRVLGAWAATGFGDEQIDEACLFLLGACSCQVKRMNPGWDLLLHFDWDEKLQALGVPVVDAEASKTSAPPAVVETVTVKPTASANPPAATSPAKDPLGLAAGAVLLAGVGAAWWTISRKS